MNQLIAGTGQGLPAAGQRGRGARTVSSAIGTGQRGAQLNDWFLRYMTRREGVPEEPAAV